MISVNLFNNFLGFISNGGWGEGRREEGRGRREEGEGRGRREEGGREGGWWMGVVKSHFPASYVFVHMSPVLICLFVIPSSSGLRPCPHVSGYL